MQHTKNRARRFCPNVEHAQKHGDEQQHELNCFSVSVIERKVVLIFNMFVQKGGMER